MRTIKYIYVDDVRTPHFNVGSSRLVICKSYKEAIEELIKSDYNEDEIILDLDHDLGSRKSGYDICLFVVENEIPLLGYKVHSSNPVGRFNIVSLMDNYGYKNLD